MQIQTAVGNAAFADMNVTAVISASPGYVPLCGNRECETDEASPASPSACPQDCASYNECPTAPADTAVGTAGEQCAGLGQCNTATRVCACPLGHAGESCSECEYGFTPRGVPS